MVTSLEGKEKTGMATIQSGSVSGNELSLTFAYGGGCDPNHSFQLFTSVSADGKKVNAVFVYNTNDVCKRLDTKTFCFNISDLRKEYSSIQINGLKDAILF